MPTNPELESAVANLLDADENQLYEQLGIRSHAMAADPAMAGMYAPPATYAVTTMGPLDGIRDFGKRLFGRWNREAWDLVCGTGKDAGADRDSLLAGLGVDKTTAAAALAALLVAQAGLAPALAAVIAALVVKRFFRPAYDEFCSTWKGSLPAAPAGGNAGGGGSNGADVGSGGSAGGSAGGGEAGGQG